jgi:hypothetical protein
LTAGLYSERRLLDIVASFVDMAYTCTHVPHTIADGGIIISALSLCFKNSWSLNRSLLEHLVAVSFATCGGVAARFPMQKMHNLWKFKTKFMVFLNCQRAFPRQQFSVTSLKFPHHFHLLPFRCSWGIV